MSNIVSTLVGEKEEKKVCTKCGKEINEKEPYLHEGNVYCCRLCCHLEAKDTRDKNICEFC